METYKKLLIPLSILTLLFLGGSLVYSNLEAYSFLDSLYYMVLTITTVGAATAAPVTIWGKILSMAVVLGGMGIVLYLVTLIAQLMVEGKMRLILGGIKGGWAKMRKEKNHVIVCGYGKVGQYVCETLEKENERYLIIEGDSDVTSTLMKEGKPVLQGDSLNPETLKKANVKEAKALVAALSSDADNLYLILSAKDINPELILAAEASEDMSVDRLHDVGAQIVVFPAVVGGRQLASALLKMEEATKLETVSEKKK